MADLENLLRQIKDAAYIGLHKGNYGLRYYLSAEQKTLIEDAIVSAIAKAEGSAPTSAER
jgi:hypothetical protein